MKITTSTEKIVPDILKLIPKEYHKFYTPETNIRTITHFKYTKPEPNTEKEYEIDYAKNRIFKNQYKLPMKMLVPDITNKYVCQKSPLSDKSDDIESASKVIEPLNIGFDEYIRCMFIDQDLEVGTTFIVDVGVPYESNQRYRFKSDQLIPDVKLKNIPFDPNIDIGELDIGSRYTGRFKVDYVNLNIYDSYTLFTFRTQRDGFDIITYDFMHVTPKYILTEVLKIVKNGSDTDKYKKSSIEFLTNCIEACK